MLTEGLATIINIISSISFEDVNLTNKAFGLKNKDNNKTHMYDSIDKRTKERHFTILGK